MKRRLSVAIALVGNPSVVFFDEPTTGLDPETRRQLWDVLLRIRHGRAVVLTTHSMEEARSHLDHTHTQSIAMLPFPPPLLESCVFVVR
jgi:ABC-type multidrug transport system ATPase subunit